jgi:hypothetical protein
VFFKFISFLIRVIRASNLKHYLLLVFGSFKTLIMLAEKESPSPS